MKERLPKRNSGKSAHSSLLKPDARIWHAEIWKKRNEYRRLSDQYKTQWEDQKQIVRDLSDLLEHLQQKMMEAEGQKTAVVAKHRNVDAEAHLPRDAERDTGQ